MPYFTHDGLDLYYEIEGQGFPIVPHTGGGGDGGMWREAGYVAGLEGYQRIIYDHRGHGRSQKPAQVADYAIERHVADVVALLDALALPRAPTGATPSARRLAMRWLRRILGASPR